jgi:phosphosulfolactate synthase (CoM biosynthesis protein A)
MAKQEGRVGAYIAACRELGFDTIVQLEALRAGLWGTTDLWGRILTYKGYMYRHVR